MSTEDRKPLPRAAIEVAELLVELASERPQVLDALRSLLLALRTEHARGAEAPVTEQAVKSATPAASPEPAAAPIERPNPEPSHTAEPTTEAERPLPVVEPVVQVAVPAQRPMPATVGAPRAKPEPRPQTAKDQASFSKLLSIFGDPMSSNGLGRSGAAHNGAQPPGRWDAHADEAKLLARLLRAQARRLKAIRLALHAGRPIPPVDHVLTDECVEDWTTDAGKLREIDAHALKEGERWYSLTARAAAAISDWLAEHPNLPLGDRITPSALRDRLQCLADAQKGIFCWIEKAFGVGASCEVQARTHQSLRRWVDRSCFAVFLPSGLVLTQLVTSDKRDDIERLLQRFDLEHAEEERPDSPTAPAAQPRRRTTGSDETAAQPDRFETVLDAFIAAKREFGGGLVVFTDRAEESAEDSAFMRPDEVYDFFAAMHELASGLARGTLAGIPIPHLFQQHGYKSKNSSSPTRQRFHRFYHMNFDGMEIDLSLHVTLGSRNQNTCLSIHWWHDSERKRFVIGHCGKHLPNSLT